MTFALAAKYDAFEAIHAFAAAHDNWEVDELFILSVILCICGFVYSVRRVRELSVEIKARHTAELEAQRLAFHDPLTGLPNRRYFGQKLQEALGRCAAGRRAAVLALDLNYFKSLNDVYGHAAGDKALVEFAERLSAAAPSGAVISRVGGDEFAIIQPMIGCPTEVTAFARRIVATATKPFVIGEASVPLGVGVGIAIAPENGTEPDSIMRRADLALYRAKAEGDSLIRFFEPDMDRLVERRAALERELRAAIENSTIEVNYQPQLQLETGRIIGFEALARWTSPTLGPIDPVEFIAVAEECGLINKLGEILLWRACREANRWPPELILSFNLSPVQLRNTSLGLRILSILAETELSPHRLELEITESALIKDAETAQRTVDELRAAGVRIALDDFGTGYATMSQLVALRFDKIKIDQSFTGRLGIDPQSDVIVRATVGLAKGLGLTTTAEGIEQFSQLEALKATGCTEGQGFLFSKAVPASEIPALLAARGDTTDSVVA
ncbi:MAG: EAL domain-containing protein [Xanthobacteraceae bacterium]